VVDNGGNKMIVGEGFRGESEAKAAMRMIAREFGLEIEPDEGRPEPGADSFDEDVLTADF
jgi:hypothetical protein